MDDEILFFILVALAALVGWLLGVIGYFKARRALREVAELRRRLGTEAAAAPVMPAAVDDTLRSGAAPVAAPAPDLAEPEPQPAATSDATPAEPSDAQPAKPNLDLEALLTTRWGIWAGALALLMAAVFLVRYAVEQDLLGPAVRCTLAALLGVALIAGAEWLRRRDRTAPPADEPAVSAAAEQDLDLTGASGSDGTGLAQTGAAATQSTPAVVFGPDLAPAALAAGGVGALFGAAYGAGPLYDLIPPLLAFVLMAAASLIGLALALLHGQVVAAIGLIGAFVTPLLVQTQQPWLPGLFGYLLFVSAAALGVVRYTAWIWLGWAATIADAMWVLTALAIGPGVDAWAPAFFVPAVAALNLWLLPPAALDHPIGRRLVWVPVAILGLTGLALCNDLQSWETRAGVLLLAPLTVAKAAQEARLRLLPFLAALLALLLFAGWSMDITDWPGPLEHPSNWTPAVVQALIATAALTAGFFAATGLWFQNRRTQPLPWASLTASVPVLALAVCYWRVALFQTRAD
ncbi:MAG: DUF2339 domain-containing protein, partial [Proteobacteria bacterium]|nr:DUF2339 domain-containing protein [Pseudomonadota bacterium]